MAMGYSKSDVKTIGATRALKMPPKTPPTEIQRKYSVRYFGFGRARASSLCMSSAVKK